MGGVGKTTVALELCRRVEAHGCRVWWINAVDPMEISSEMLEIARQVGAPQGDIDDARAGRRNAADLVWGSLNSASRWLLVFDNADDPSVLGSNRRPMAEGKGWARPSRSGLTLVTSRRGDVAIWGAAARVHHLGVLTAAEGAQVLQDLAPNAGSAQEAVTLADRLGGLPLALHLAGSYINDVTAIRTFAAYRHELDVRFRDLMSAADVEGIEASRRRAVTTTWEISLDDLADRGLPHTRELLQIMSFYAPATPIPGALLNNDTASGDTTNGKQESAGEFFTSALRGLRSVGLIDVRTTGPPAHDKGVVVHPLVAETTFLSMSAEQREQRGRTTAELIRWATADLETQRPEHWPQWRIVSPHLSAIIGRRVVEPAALASLMETACRGTWALCESGDYGAAEDLARECIGAAGPLGTDHPAVLTVRHELGGVLRERGRPAAAEAEYREVLEARARLLGADHPTTFSTLRQLSGALWDLDRLTEAEAGYRTVLAQQVQVNGTDDPAAIHTRHDLAGVLASQGRFAEAQGEYESALAAGLRVLGPEHPSVLSTCHQLAGVLRSRHRIGEAELTCRAVLDRRTTTFGPDHVATISSLHRLGRILQDQGRTAKAEAAYRDALDRCLRSVGVRHPLTRDVQNDLDALLQNSTRHPEQTAVPAPDACAPEAQAGRTGSQDGGAAAPRTRTTRRRWPIQLRLHLGRRPRPRRQ